jgi:hypothetical protein
VEQAPFAIEVKVDETLPEKLNALEVLLTNSVKVARTLWLHSWRRRMPLVQSWLAFKTRWLPWMFRFLG